MAKQEERFDRKGAIRKMAEADAYVMVRRPGCAPFVLSIQQWHSLWTDPHPAASPSEGDR